MAAKKSPAQAVPAQAVADSAGFYCYIGPGVGGAIRHGEIFRGGRAEALKATASAVEKLPPVKTLLVPGEGLAAALERVSQPGNALRAAYDKIIELAKEPAKGGNGNA